MRDSPSDEHFIRKGCQLGALRKIITACLVVFAGSLVTAILFSDDIKMPIPFGSGVDVNDLVQRPAKTCDVVEEDPLGEPCLASSPAFVVWRNGKHRVVVDLRRVNTKLPLDAYLLLRQDEIFNALQGFIVFSVMDVTKGVFQQDLATEDH